MSYKVTGNIKHNKKVLKIGSIVELDDKHAKPLLEMGVIEKTGKKKESAPVEDNKNTNDDGAGDDNGDNNTGDDNGDDNGDGDDDENLDEMKQAELKALAEVEEVDITGLRKNADIIAAIRAKREENDGL